MYDHVHTEKLVDQWLIEDVGNGDLTANLIIDAAASTTFDVNAREDMVVAGIEVMATVFRRYVPGVSIDIRVQDGARVAKGTVLARVSGQARGLLTAERTALNILQRLSGIATETARFVAAIAGTKAQMIDTRKTTPGLRALEKHAVLCGGARNHRLGLDSGVMLKDNHIAVCGGISQAVARAKAAVPILAKVEVECDRLDQVREALEAGADVIMLDNMSLADMRSAVAFIDGRVPLEASGGVRYETIRGIAETGVDFISSSKITQSAPAVDIGLDEAV
ncbi:MAG TPA: carboxylating nicotinate-nucleotide diphosphorylase [Aliidongia sp.]|uniref:carboxylating nicotinate-nucleotide diphosphorylase n=1 Tax=Aliidongia sp. TaxID=1914230 RepID=UPI002DDDB29B|nr:carboxylating nicotinate-nucleotide diphosphorylase [Aliidongia sp.]HEV2677071.1 carboxylating nicotinate-nucleotide diphosphorylase [Aliidongia sp.]